ncbi:MAG: hypothetical protein HY511_02310 [Actinobacteria bacterium]|nr:hypothetical protein [Actinomycetota bacterium]
MRKALFWCLAALAVAGIWAAAGGASHPPGTAAATYTLDADFDEGTLLNVNHNSPNNDQLQLNTSTTPFPFVNIAASARGTAVRIDVNTGAVLGEYLTAPDGMARNPSRTTVDQLGNVWVANRDEFGFSGGSSKGSVARVGLILGGTRVDAAGMPDANGDYLAPPFSYNTCVDRNFDNRIKTSRGLLDIRPWPNPSAVDSNGGVSSADDECIINYTRVTGTGTRTVAVDANNDVWVGGLGDQDHEKVSGVTGLPVAGTQINYGCGGYGGLIDGSGFLWSAPSAMLRFDTNSVPPPPGTGTCLGTVPGAYGLGIDPNTGRVWTSRNVFPLTLSELNPDGTVRANYPLPAYWGFTQGLAVDGNSHVWVAQGFGGEVAHFAPDPANPGFHLFVGVVTGFAGTTGVAVDANGKIWASEISSSTTRGAARIDPSVGPVGAGGYNVGAIDLTVGLDVAGFPSAGPYNYSDMTGFVAIGSTSPQGTWTVVRDGGAVGASWGTITWNNEPQGSEPAGTSITVVARAADTQAGLSSQTFISTSNGVPFSLTGRFIEVRATLKASSQGVSPVLSDLTIQGTAVEEMKGRMTGGGSVFTTAGARVTHGFELHCDASKSPNNLQVNWGKGNRFHLGSLTSASCSNDASISEGNPVAGFDTYTGKGTGIYNGTPGASAEWTFTDAGEPGTADYVSLTIKDTSNTTVLTVTGTLKNGNQQAHAN